MMDEIKQATALLRERHGFSQAQKTFGDWLNGRTRCRHQTMLLLALEALAARLHVRPGESSGLALTIG